MEHYAIVPLPKNAARLALFHVKHRRYTDMSATRRLSDVSRETPAGTGTLLSAATANRKTSKVVFHVKRLPLRTRARHEQKTQCFTWNIPRPTPPQTRVQDISSTRFRSTREKMDVYPDARATAFFIKKWGFFHPTLPLTQNNTFFWHWAPPTSPRAAGKVGAKPCYTAKIGPKKSRF